MRPEAVRLARKLVTEPRLGFLTGAEVVRVAGAVQRLRGWTVEDVVAEVRLRLAECGKPQLEYAAAPAAYLAWLLGQAVPDEPPAQIAAALAAAVGTGQRTVEPRQPAVPAAQSAAGRAVRKLVDELAGRHRAERPRPAPSPEPAVRDLPPLPPAATALPPTPRDPNAAHALALARARRERAERRRRELGLPDNPSTPTGADQP